MKNLAIAAWPCRGLRGLHQPVLGLIVLLGTLLIALSSSADAAQSFPQLSKLCPSGTAGGQCGQASGLAMSKLDGHLFEVDTRNNRVQEFTPWGEFVKAFGWSVVASGPGNKPRNEIQQLAITATGGSFKLRYGTPPGSGSFTVTETAAIPFQPGTEPSSSQVQSALVNAPFSGVDDPFGPGDLNVSGPAGGPWAIEFIGRYADKDFGGGLYSLEPKGEGLTGGGAAAALTTTQLGGNYEICVPADGDVCTEGSPGVNPGQFGGGVGTNLGPEGVALDSSGNVYVVDRRNHRVQKFDSAGNFRLMFGGDVNKTTGEDVCTAAQVEGGDECGAGTVGSPGPGEGQFGPWEVNLLPNLGDYIAIGPDDTVYVGDINRIQRFGTDGSFQGQTSGAVAGETVQALDVSPQGDLYVTFANTSSSLNLLSKPNVRRLDGSGTQIAQLPVANPRGIATDAQGNVFVIDGNTGTFTSKVLGFTSSGEPIDLQPNGPGTALGEGAVLETTGIATASPPTCGLDTTNIAIGSYLTNGTANSIFLYGGAPDPGVCPQPQAPPVIESQFANSVDTTSATIRARINPRFWPDTRYFVQYGSGKCSEGGCTLSKPASPGALLTSEVRNTSVLTNAVLLTGLLPGQVYHYRFVTQSGGGGPVTGAEQKFRTARVPGDEDGCANDEFRIGQSANLPDCRAYELVSPLDKSNGDISRTAEFSVAQADPSGGRMSFSSLRSFGNPEGAPLVSQYLGQRQGAGWTTASISPPRSVPSLYPLGGSESNFFKALSEDLCSGWVLQDNPKLLTSGAPDGVPNVYRRDNCGGGGYELVTSTLPPGFGPVPYSTYYFPTPQGFSNDARRTVVRANAALAVSAGGPRPPFVCSPLANVPGVGTSYRWLRDGAPIGGATQPTYTYANADVGKTVQCQVTSTASGRTSIVASEALLVAPAASPAPPNPGFKPANAADLPGAPKIIGSPVAGEALTCEPGPWQGSPTFAYLWFRNGSAIGAATSSSYVTGPADEGTSIQCRVTGSNAGGSAISFSRSVTVAANLPFTSDAPAITGTPASGETLTCEEGTWQGGPSFAYQWLRNGAAIGGALTSGYTLTAADEGKAIQCRVQASNAEAAVAATSPRVVIAPLPATAPPSQLTNGGINGTPEIGKTLTCEEGTWQGGPSFAYQWLRNGAAIGGALTSEYILTAADEGKAIQCQLSVANAGGTVVALAGNGNGTVYAAPPAAPSTAITTRGNLQLYLSSGESLRLISVLPNGAATADSATAGVAWSLSLGPNSREDAFNRAVSDDGNRVFWTATTYEGPESSGTGPGSLYLRLNATEPQSAISGGKCTEPTKACTIPVSASSTARFVSADPQGSRVVYMTGSSNPEVGIQLFTGDVDESGSEAVVDSELVANGVRGVVGVSEDASRIYFVSLEDLTDDPNSEGAEAVAGQANLYFFEEGSSLDFVATLAGIDVREGESRPGAGSIPTSVALSPNRRSSRVSSDGLHMAFTATASPTGYDNSDTASGEPAAEVYLYDAGANSGAGRLLCVSCNPSGGQPTGRLSTAGTTATDDDVWTAAVIPGWNSAHQPSRALSENGSRVFFNAYDSLVPGDGNGRADVYQWEAPGEGTCTEASAFYSEQNGGCVRLISSGQSAEDAEFLDAAASGSDVFFITQASLVSQDYGLRDVYDARVNGGFAPPPSLGAGCQGETCQNPPPPPSDPLPPSNTFVGPGNVKEQKPAKRCPKGKHKVKKNGKTVCAKNKKVKGKQGKRGSRKSRGGAR